MPLAAGLQYVEDRVHYLAQAHLPGPTDRESRQQGLQAAPRPLAEVARIALLAFFWLMSVKMPLR